MGEAALRVDNCCQLTNPYVEQVQYDAVIEGVVIPVRGQNGMEPTDKEVEEQYGQSKGQSSACVLKLYGGNPSKLPT